MARSSSHQDNAEDTLLKKRLAKIVADSSQAEVARRTNTSQQNVARYLKGVRIPASFISRLVKDMGVNPSWLTTGEGTPYLSDVSSTTQAMAGDVLELIKAMSAVTNMRLGALAGKQHLRALHELNEALQTYEKLKHRLSEHSADIFRHLLRDLNAALANDELDKAISINNAADQLVRLCEDESLKTSLIHLQAWLTNMRGDRKGAVEIAREAFLRTTALSTFGDDLILSRSLNMINILKQNGSSAEACRMCHALVELSRGENVSRNFEAELGWTLGYLRIDIGELHKGLTDILKYLPLLRDYARNEARTALAIGQVWAGVITLEQAAAIPVESLWHATMTGSCAISLFDQHALEIALSYLVGEGPWKFKAKQSQAVALDCMLRAHHGEKKALADFERFWKAPPQDSMPNRRSSLFYTLFEVRIAGLLGMRNETTKAFKQAQKLFESAPDEADFGISLRATYHGNVLRLDDVLKAPPKVKRAAKAFFRNVLDAGYIYFRPFEEQVR